MVDMEVSYSKANEFKPLTTKTFTTYTSNYFQTSNKYKNTTKNTSINYQNEENDSYDDSYAFYDKFSKQGQYEKDSFHYKKLLTSKLLLKKIEILKNSINNLKIKILKPHSINLNKPFKTQINTKNFANSLMKRLWHSLE